jgi:hypothetical protein
MRSMHLQILLCWTILYFLGHCLGAIYESVAELPKDESFDFIVVGGRLIFLLFRFTITDEFPKVEQLEM